MNRIIKGGMLFLLPLTMMLTSVPGWTFEVDTHALIASQAFVRSSVPQALGNLGVDPNGRLSCGLLCGARPPVEWLQKGSRDEDTLPMISIVPVRFRNHFYDPYYDRGLTVGQVRLGERALRDLSSSGSTHADLRLDLGPGGPPHYPEVVVRLQVEPDLGRNAEVLPEPEGSIRGDRPLAADDLADTIGRNVNIPGQPVNTDAQGLHEFLEQDFPWGDGVQ